MEKLSSFLVRYELAIEQTRDNERRCVSANPELIIRLLGKLKGSGNRVLKLIVEKDRAFDGLRERLEAKWIVDTSSYPNIQDIMDGDSDDSDDPAIINNVQFGQMQMGLNMFNDKILSDNSDSDGFLSDDDEPLEDENGEVLVRGRGGARNIEPVDLDIDDEDFEMDEYPDDLDPGEQNEEARERVKPNNAEPIKMDAIFDKDAGEEKELILSDEEGEEPNEEYDIQKSLINEVLNSAITDNIKELNNDSTATNEDVIISVEKQGDSKKDA